ncbi:hypothetical protein BG22_07325 [Bifidobacterium sp. UTBIF-78]|nr:hypothetical protein BG22_07325 [Bifidobacterium sp. UTBIF-78]
MREGTNIGGSKKLEALVQRPHIAAAMQYYRRIRRKDMTVIHQILDVTDLINLVIAQAQARQVGLLRQGDGLIAEIAVIGDIAQQNVGGTSPAIMSLQIFLCTTQSAKRPLRMHHAVHAI